MKKIVIALFFITSIVSSQEKVTKNLGDFNTLKVYRGLHIQLIKSDTSKIVIEGEKSEEVVVKNVNGILKISMTVLETFSADKVLVNLYFSNEIDILNVNEGSIISSEEVFEQNKMELKAEEGGEINLELNTFYLDVKTVTGGIITLKGFSKNQNIKAYTGGIYEGKKLKTEYTNVTASTGGIATVNASNLVDAKSNLGAAITIKGEPLEIKKKESLGGYVR